jgi:aminoglycoside 6-adenylyltransferase
MENNQTSYEQIIEQFVRWATNDPGVRAAIVLGSRARTDHPADEWSDLDIDMFVDDPERYLSSTDWVTRIGEIWLTFVEITGDGLGYERRVLFAGGIDVDFSIDPVSLVDQMVATGIPAEFADTLRRGRRVLVDKDHLMQKLQAPGQPENLQSLPTEPEFVEFISDFWYHAVWTAKKLRRGELWTAHACMDGYMKRQLLRVIEWHTLSAHTLPNDIWHKGRFLEQWADTRIIRELKDTFAHYDQNDVWRGLFATMGLFRWVAAETAAHLKYSYPTLIDEHVTELVNEFFAQRNQSER